MDWRLAEALKAFQNAQTELESARNNECAPTVWASYWFQETSRMLALYRRPLKPLPKQRPAMDSALNDHNETLTYKREALTNIKVY